jgi:hypothetical protein
MEHDHGAFKVNRKIKALPVNWARSGAFGSIGDRGGVLQRKKLHAGNLAKFLSLLTK